MSVDIFCGDMWHMLSAQFLKCPNHFLKKTLTFLNLIFCMNWPLIYIILLLCLREGGSHFISEVTIFLIHKLARHAVSKLIQIKPVLQYLAILCSTGKGYVHYCPHLLGYDVMEHYSSNLCMKWPIQNIILLLCSREGGSCRLLPSALGM